MHEVKGSPSPSTVPLQVSVKSLPVNVVRFGLAATTDQRGLLRQLCGARVDDVAEVRSTQHSLQQELILLTASSVSSDQGLAAAHDHLAGQTQPYRGLP